MADVAVRGERIASIGTGLRGRREIDADGLYVLPGAVDGHVHMRTDRPRSRLRRHVRDGHDRGRLRRRHRDRRPGPGRAGDHAPRGPRPAAGRGRRGLRSIDYGLHVNLREPIARAGRRDPAGDGRARLPDFKLFMSYETYRLPDDIIFARCRRSRRIGGMAVVHAENGAIIDELLRENAGAGRMRPVSVRRGISPPVMEGEAAHRALAHRPRSPAAALLIFHLTTVDARRASCAGRASAGQDGVRRGAACTHLLLGEELSTIPCSHRVHGHAAAALSRAPRRRSGRRWPTARSTSSRPTTARAGGSGRERHAPTPAGTSGVEVRLALMHTEGVLGGPAHPAALGRALLHCPGPPARARSARAGCARATTPTSCSSTRARAHALGRGPALERRPLDVRGHRGPRLPGRDHRRGEVLVADGELTRRAGPRPVRPPRAPRAGLTYWSDGRARHRGRRGAPLCGADWIEVAAVACPRRPGCRARRCRQLARLHPDAERAGGPGASSCPAS